MLENEQVACASKLPELLLQRFPKVLCGIGCNLERCCKVLGGILR